MTCDEAVVVRVHDALGSHQHELSKATETSTYLVATVCDVDNLVFVDTGLSTGGSWSPS